MAPIVRDVAPVKARTIQLWLLILGALALALAVIGIFRVVSFAAAQRTKEVGIRIALGAKKLDIFRAILIPGLRPITAGIFVGLLLSVAGARVLAQALRGAPIPIDTRDPFAYAVVCILLVVVTVVAMLVPAWHVAASDPVKALRDE